MLSFTTYKNFIKNKIYNFLGLNLLKQEAMLRLALKEEGLNYKNFDIRIDHVNGLNFVNGIEFPIIYPKSFFKKAKELHHLDKKLTYYFNGNMSNAGGRKEMLSKFFGPNSSLIESEYGRSIFTKNKFNKAYYSELASSKFGLCPHQKDFEGNKKTMWTYRFIECCMVLTIPIIFKETPLGENFIKGFYCYGDDEILSKQIIYQNNESSKNFELCQQKFTFSEDDILRLAQSLKN